ncbi:MAG: T9SS type A sorting domain-containing protein [Sphingobacteriaceae bacterium]|nr:T9SS type A sorting domain-containing protein [Sphingobacteriaceae bacterium]
MKKTLLTILGLLGLTAAFGQPMPSPSWTIQQNASFSITSAGIRFLDAIDVNTVWVTGYNGGAPNQNYNWWAKSTDGGTTFTSGNTYADTNTYIMANMEGIDGNTAWVSAYLKGTTDRGAAHTTTNGGTTWTNMLAPNMYSVAGQSFLNVVSFWTPSVGMLQGDAIGGEMELYRTTDAGATWTQVPGANIPNPTAGEYGLVNVYCKEGTTNHWFGTNKNRMYRSFDAGLTWSVSALTSTIGGGAALGVTDVAFVNQNYGLASCYWGPTGQGTLTLFNTTDGGATWNLIPNVDPNFGLNDFCAIPGTAYFASCGNGAGNQLLSFSTDNGVTWNSWNSQNIGYLAIDFASSQVGWVGSFSSNTLASSGGVFKYSGPNLFVPTNAVADFTVNASQCASVAVTMTNNSTGAPIPTYTWSTNPAASISNSNAVNPSITFTATGPYTITLIANNTGSTSTTTRTVDVSICAGVNEIASAINSMNVFPNPAKDQLNINITGVIDYSFLITDVLGKPVKAGLSGGEKVSLNVSDLASGIYFLTVQSQGHKSVKKIIIE